MLRINSICILVLFFTGAGIKAQPETPGFIQLKSKDVEHFIKTFPVIKKDFEKMGIRYEKSNQRFTIPEEAQYVKEMNSLLSKNGYSDQYNFYVLAASIASCYAYLKGGPEMQEAVPKIEQAMKEIEENPDISPEQKQQMKAIMEQSLASMRTVENDMATPENIKAVKPHMEDLDVIFNGD